MFHKICTLCTVTIIRILKGLKGQKLQTHDQMSHHKLGQLSRYSHGLYKYYLLMIDHVKFFCHYFSLMDIALFAAWRRQRSPKATISS